MVPASSLCGAPVDGSKLGPSEGQVPVGPESVLVDEAVEGAVHGLDLVGLVLHVHLVEHAVLVEVEVAWTSAHSPHMEAIGSTLSQQQQRRRSRPPVISYRWSSRG